MLRPTTQVLESVFPTDPFAVNVPFEVRHEGGVVQLAFRIQLNLDNPPKDELGHGSWRHCLTFCDAGLYRLDGQQMTADSVFGPRFLLESPSNWPKLVWDSDGPVPTWTFWRFKRPAPDKRATIPWETKSFALSPAQPGWYVFWFANDPQASGVDWPEKDAKRDNITGRIHVETVVSRGPRLVSDEEFSFLFGRRPRPDGMGDTNMFRASLVEIPLTVRRDGWVFAHAEVRPLDDAVRQNYAVTREGTAKDNEIRSSAQALGSTVNLRLSTTTWNTFWKGELGAGKDRNNQPAKVEYTTDSTWTVKLPTVIPDGGFAVMEVSGGRKTNGASYHPYNYHWEPRGLGYGFGLDTVHETLAGDRKSFLENYGQDALDEWWFEDIRRDLSNGPQDGKPCRYLLRGKWILGWLKDRETREQTAKSLSKEAQERVLQQHMYPVIYYRFGPWAVVGYYTRLKDQARPTSASMPSGGPTQIVDEHDSFWAWRAKFSRLVKERLDQVNAAQGKAALPSMVLQTELRSHAVLMQAITSEDQEPDSTETGISDRIWDRIYKLTTKSQDQGPDSTFNLLIKHAREKSARIRKLRTELDGIMKEAADAYADIIAETDRGFDKYGDRHPEVLLWKRDYRDAAYKMAINLALATGDRNALRQAMDQAEHQSLSVDCRLLQSQLRRMDGDPAGALEVLRSTARSVDPMSRTNAFVQKALMEAECAFLKTAINKSQGAIKEAREAFYKYLSERGFSQDDKHPISSYPWIVQLSAPLWQLDGEAVWAILSTGLSGSLTGILGKPQAQADLLSSTETQMTTAFLGLHTMLRLRMRGYTFAQIKNMTSHQIRDALPLRDLQGKLYSDERARQLGVAIHEAMQLPDIQALVMEDPVGLRLGLQKDYWNPRDLGDTWAEWMGDITSVHNLAMLLLPLAKSGSVPTAIVWGERELEAIDRAQAAGRVISGTEVVARLVRWDRAMAWVGKTWVGEPLLETLLRYEKYHEKLGRIDRAIWGIGKFMGLIAVMCGASELAEEHGGPAAMLALEGLFLFATDTGSLIKFLKAEKIPLRAVERALRSRVIPALDQEAQRILADNKLSERMTELLQKARKGPLSPREIKELEEEYGKYWRRPYPRGLGAAPTGKPSDDVKVALAAAANGARNGVDNGALASTRELLPALKEEAEQCAKASQQAKKIADDLSRAAEGELDGVPISLRPPSTFKNTKYLTDGKFEYPVPPVPPTGSHCAKAEQALHSGDYDGALRLYAKARKLVADGLVKDADELPREFIELKMALAQDLKKVAKVAKRTPGALSKKLSEPVSDQEFANVMNDFLNNRGQTWTDRGHQGVVGKLWRKEGSSFVIKEVQEDVLRNVEGELVSEAIERVLGMDTPGMHVRLVRNAQGEVEKAYLVMRKIEGSGLHELSPGEIFLFRQELSRHRALSLLLGDFDRKVDNYLISTDGRLFSIDHGYADPRGIDNRLFSYIDHIPPDADARTAGILGRDHWLSRSYKDEMTDLLHNKPAPKSAPFTNLWGDEARDMLRRKILVAEQSLTYQAGKPMVDEIGKLLGDEPKLREILDRTYRRIYADEAHILGQIRKAVEMDRQLGRVVDEERIRRQVLLVIEEDIGDSVRETLATLKKRFIKLDKVMQGLNQRNCIPLSGAGTSSIRCFDPGVSENIIFLPFVEAVELRRAA